MQIFVTGGTGLVGAHLLLELLRKHIKVRALKRAESDLSKVIKTFSWYEENPEEFFSRIEWVDGDVLDHFSLEEALEGVDQVYHCAGKVSFESRDRHAMLRVNRQGTANLVNVALDKGIGKLCHVSSVSALGRSRQGETITERHFWKTSRHNSIYAQSKYAAEREVWRGIEEGLNAVIVNPSIILGPGEWSSGSTRLFSAVYKGMPFYSDGVSGYVDVRDVATIMIRLMESEISGERFVISAEDISYRDLFREIAAQLNVRPPWLKVQPWMGEIGWRIFSLFDRSGNYTRETTRAAFKHYYYDNSKITRQLNFSFIPIRKSIAHTASIFLNDQV